MLMNTHLQSHHSIHFSKRSRLSIAFACILFAPHPHVNAETKPPSSKRENLTIVSQEIMKPWTGDLDGMIKRRTIRILTVYNRTSYFVDKGVQRGGSYDIGRLFVDDLNKKLAKDNKHKHLKVHAVFIPVARSELLPALRAGKGDVAMASVGVTEERLKLVDFSAPLVSNVKTVVVSGPGSAAISSVDDLSGKQVFVRKSSVYYSDLVALNKRFAAQKKPAVIIKEAPEALEDEDLIEMVNAGLIPFTVSIDAVANFWGKVFPKIKVHEEVNLRADGDIAWAMRKGSPKFKAAADEFVVRHAQGTAIGNQILAKYLKSTKHVKDAGSEAERRKFLALVQYFQKYGEKYDVDWMLMAAQGYQESQLNQNAKSPVGAIGVMQVMPATGKDLNVGDIHKVEPNINAGIKYMRWMIDNYYGKEPMTNLDKALFAIASYNAGAGRVSGLRKEAAKRGLDPNIWFHNVEYIAAEKIGAETVTYVSNIYKYYIAYSLIMESRAEKEKAVKQMNDTPRR
jgi:membrane-bound lytic murein transglycosylase MltF